MTLIFCYKHTLVNTKIPHHLLTNHHQLLAHLFKYQDQDLTLDQPFLSHHWSKWTKIPCKGCTPLQCCGWIGIISSCHVHLRSSSNILFTKKESITTLGAIDLSNYHLMTFDINQIAPRFPSSMAFQIPVNIKNICIYRWVIDEGASTCVMSTKI